MITAQFRSLVMCLEPFHLAHLSMCLVLRIKTKRRRLSKEKKKIRLRSSEILPGMNYDWGTIKDGDCIAWNLIFYCWYWKELLISKFYFMWDNRTIQNKECYSHTQVFATNIQHQVIQTFVLDCVSQVERFWKISQQESNWILLAAHALTLLETDFLGRQNFT